MYYVLTRDGNTFIGVTRDNAYAFNLPNVSIHEMDDPIPDLNQHVWDFEQGVFVPSGSVLSKREFMSLLTLTERATIRTSTDPVVIDIMSMFELAEYINKQDPATIQAIQYLAYVGLLTAERAAEVLT